MHVSQRGGVTQSGQLGAVRGSLCNDKAVQMLLIAKQHDIRVSSCTHKMFMNAHSRVSSYTHKMFMNDHSTSDTLETAPSPSRGRHKLLPDVETPPLQVAWLAVLPS